ncbi:MAG: helix-turn-helix domain-containing protein [Thermoplasmata archaeon]|nr:helix-turn-helix domain-containing protein [Thermoplasmata archaeon]
MKSIQLYMDLQKLGMVNSHFYLHDKRLVVTKIINYDGGHITYIAEISRSDFIDEKTISLKKEEIIKRYSLETFELISVDRKNKNYRVLIVQKLPDLFSMIYNEMNYSAFIVPPVIVSSENMMVTLLVKDEKLDYLLQFLKKFGINYRIIRKTMIPRERGLTVRQWDVAITAISMGYYSIPKKAKLKDIAKKFKISVPAVQRILRSVEIKAMEEYFNPLL